MAVFAILAEGPNPTLGEVIKETYPKDFYPVSDSQWLVSTETIARSLADRLDLRSGEFGRVIVVPIGAMPSGWQAKSLWDWIREKGDLG